ncbi:MAG: peptidylprolyl isomerase [Bacteroidaceae bacterium]|nr:peptidylprolyl isomerase [Bacteroidaceae bacterium]
MRKNLLLLLFICCSTAIAQPTKERSTVTLHTTKGDITIALYNETPIHRDNFLTLCQNHFYDSLLFHRVIEGFMIQGGDPDSKGARLDKPLGDGGPGYDLPAEICFPKLYHRRGVVAAAREGDDVNPERRSSGSQFYIVWGKRFTKREIKSMADTIARRTKQNVILPDSIRQVYTKTGGTPHLDGQYTVFGEVIKGLDIVERIQKVVIRPNNRPFDDVIILSTTVE